MISLIRPVVVLLRVGEPIKQGKVDRDRLQVDALVVYLRAVDPPLRVVLQELPEVGRDDGVGQQLLDEDVVVLHPRVEPPHLPHYHLRVLPQVPRLDEAQKPLEKVLGEVLGVPLQQCLAVVQPLMEEAHLLLPIILLRILPLNRLFILFRLFIRGRGRGLVLQGLDRLEGGVVEEVAVLDEVHAAQVLDLRGLDQDVVGLLDEGSGHLGSEAVGLVRVANDFDDVCVGALAVLQGMACHHCGRLALHAIILHFKNHNKLLLIPIPLLTQATSRPHSPRTAPPAPPSLPSAPPCQQNHTGMEHYQSLQYLQPMFHHSPATNINHTISYSPSSANSGSPSPPPAPSPCSPRSPSPTSSGRAQLYPPREAQRFQQSSICATATAPSPSLSAAAHAPWRQLSSPSGYFPSCASRTSGFRGVLVRLGRGRGTQSPLGVDHQHLLYEAEEVLGVSQGDALELALLDLLGEGQVVAGLEGAPEGSDLVDEAASRPDVRLLVVLAVAHLLGRHVVGRAHVGLRELGVLAHLAAQPEVPQLDVVVLVDEDVGRLDVPVQHLPALAPLVRHTAVAVVQGEQQLEANLPDDFLLDIVHGLLGFLQFSAEVAPGAVLHYDVDLGVDLVHHAVNVPDDVGVLQLLQEVHFRHQLLLLATAHLLEIDLLPHEGLPALPGLHLAHHSEGALADLLQGDVLLHFKYNDCQY